MINKIYLKRGLLAVFSFTLMFAFFGCTEDLAIDVEVEETKTITVDITEEMYQAYLDSVEVQGNHFYVMEGALPTDNKDIDEYKDRVESMEIEKVTVKMVNETTPPSNVDFFYFSFNTRSVGDDQTWSPIILRNGVELDLDKADYSHLETSFLEKNPIFYFLGSMIQGPSKFDLEITVKGKLKVKAKAD